MSDFESISRLVDGTLPADDTDCVVELLRSSADARAQYRMLAAMDSDLHDLAAGLSDIGATPSFDIKPDRETERPLIFRHWKTFVAAAAVAVLFVVVFFSIPQQESTDQPFIALAEGTVSMELNDDTIAEFSGPARFRMRSADTLELERGHVIVRSVSLTDDFRIQLASGFIRPGAGEFGISTDGTSSEVHAFDGNARLIDQRNGTSVLYPGRTALVNSIGRLTPIALSDSSLSHVPGRIRHGAIADRFDASQSSHQWESALGKDVQFVITDDAPMARSAGAFLRIVGNAPVGAGEITIPAGSAYRTTKGHVIRATRTYAARKKFNPNKAHVIEFLVRIDGDTKGIERVAIFDGHVGDGLEPLQRNRTWHIHANVPEKQSELNWFVWHPSPNDKFEYLPFEANRTYRVFVEIDPKKRRYRATISNGMNSIYNRRGDAPPRFPSRTESLARQINLMVYAKPNVDVKISIDEMLIYNAPIDSKSRIN